MDSSPARLPPKRVLPSRARRGGPGVGNCDIDVMILETRKRKFENEPLIPADTYFLLTTNPSVTASSSDNSPLRLNLYANDRYFDRPEVLKAYREQRMIETPEFISLAESPSVPGRFRVRSSEDGTVDTSDAAYEKRHRKYETFEKRQRLREKEKLKHEQYKLKERIEQLRAMDSSAFLSLPASAFSPIPGHTAEDTESGSANSLSGHANGAAAYNEGERRRKEMLEVAYTLEERYRVLLPSDRVKKHISQTVYNRRTPEQDSVSSESSKKGLSDDAEDSRLDASARDSEKLKLKIRFPSRTRSSAPASAPVSKRRRQSLAPSASPKRKIHYEVAMPDLASPQAETDVISTSPGPSMSPLTSDRRGTRLITPMSNPEIAVLEMASSPNMPEEAPSEPHPRKRRKMSRGQFRQTSIPPIESLPDRKDLLHQPASFTPSRQAGPSTSTGRVKQSQCVLMIAALRSSGSKVKKAARHLSAFGVKLRSEVVEEAKDFSIPAWALPQDAFERKDYPTVVLPAGYSSEEEDMSKYV